MRLKSISVGALFLLASSHLSAGIVESVRSKIDEMIDSKYSYKILTISDVIDNIVVASLTPPYREFPNVILFKRTQEGALLRVQEGLSLGIQDEQSPFLDMHTVGNAVDLAVDFGLGRPLRFTDDQTKKLFTVTQSSGLVAVLYGKFVHTHVNKAPQVFYVIDKTQYKDLAIELLGERYNFYPDMDCTMYDTPPLKMLKFSRKGARYYIEAETENHQKWTVTFSDIDADTNLLLNKNIAVKALVRSDDTINRPKHK